MKCTWKNCTNEGTIEQKDKKGNVWATLCKEHDNKLTDSISRGDPKLMMQSWVLAGGGAEKMVERIFKK